MFNTFHVVAYEDVKARFNSILIIRTTNSAKLIMYLASQTVCVHSVEVFSKYIYRAH